VDGRKEDVMRTPRLEITETFLPRRLTEHDRCDRCGSQAYVEVSLSTGELLFCAHHFQAFEGHLRSIATAVLDERDRLHADSSRGSAYSSTST
jgi:hypothetical protein